MRVNYYDTNDNEITAEDLKDRKLKNTAWVKTIGSVVKRLESEGIIFESREG